MLPLYLATLETESQKQFIRKIYIEYYPLMKKYALSISSNALNSDDIINEAIIKLIVKVELLQSLSSCKLATYIVYTIKSVAIDFVRSANRKSKWAYYSLDDNESNIADSIKDVTDNPEQLIILKENSVEISNILSMLPEIYRDILHYKYTLEMSDAEISNIIGIKPASVRQYLTRARRKAKDLLTQNIWAGDKRE